MNTTDFEKIECKLEKELNCQAKFANIEEVKNENVERWEMSNENVDAVNYIEKNNQVLEINNVESEFVSDSLNSCTEKIITNMSGSPIDSNLTLEDTLTISKTDAYTASVIISAEEQQISGMTDICKHEAVMEFEDCLQPLSERWSPLGANYEDSVTPSSELISPESELELLSSDSRDKHGFHHEDDAEIARLKCLEEEQEMLTSSLMALTSHFAHVQLRVRQIVEAPTNERDQLLKDLEQFAFQGIPETRSAKATATIRSSTSLDNNYSRENVVNSTISEQEQFELITHLKEQLVELEKVAYESGAPLLPQHILLEKQKIIIDELKQKLNFKVDEKKLPELTAEELKSQVDNAIGEFVGPLKMKEQLVAQLKTQITDLERFIAYLQCDPDESKIKTLGGEKFCEAYNSYSAKKKKESNKQVVGVSKLPAHADEETVHTSIKLIPVVESKTNLNSEDSLRKRESFHNKAHGLLDKASLLMQMFATNYFGSKQEQFQKNTLKKTQKGNHWGDLRAQLEVDIQEVASLAATLSFDREKLTKLRKAMKKSKTFADTEEAAIKNGIITKIPSSWCRNNSRTKVLNNEKHLHPYTVSSGSDDDDFDAYDYYDWQQQNNRRVVQCARTRGDTIITLSKELTTAVRKNFAMTLMKLMQHGLRVESMPPVTSSLIVPFMRCLNPSPVFVAEHNYRARDCDASSFIPSTASYGYDDSKGTGSNNSNEGAFFRNGSTRPMHAWELILEYYYLKHGDEYNNTPARKLSQSFNLDIVNSQVVTAKQNMLTVVGSIIAMHRPYKRSYNTHFKAFVCAGLNCHQLVEWLNLIFSCTDLMENYYTNSSYVAYTGFRDALRAIDTLSKYEFHLPVDLAIRHFRNL